ncbi:MAG: hypothetical protein Q9184_006401 [Pyrenodesmia sp. 2 TL-2023]
MESLRRLPGIPPGPYFDTNNDPQPTLTKDVAHVLRRSVSPVHSYVGQYIYSNCYPLHFFHSYEQDFSLYLCAALAKHWSIRHYLQAVARCDYSSMSVSYEVTTNIWRSALFVYEANGKWLSDTEKMDMVQREEKLMVIALNAYPCLLDLTYHMNSTALVNTWFSLATLKVSAPGTTTDDMEHRLLCVQNAYIYLLSVFTDISTLPDQFWAKFQATQGASESNWWWLMRNAVRALKYAKILSAKIQDAIDARKVDQLIQVLKEDRLNGLVQNQGA